jgi:AraC-like DNA-binding protein
MNKTPGKKYHAVDSELACEVKSDEAPFDVSDDMHNHACHEILIVLNGHINMYTEYSGITLSKGDAALIPMYVFHNGIVPDLERYDRIVINVDEGVLKAASGPNMDLNGCFVPYNDHSIHSIHLEDEDLADIENYAVNLQKCILSNEPGADIAADAFLKLIMIKVNSHYSKSAMTFYPNTMPELVRKTFDYVDKHLTENISLSMLENEIHNNGTYISRCLKKISGLSLSQYIIAKRITLACKLLKEGKNASDACYMSGFNNYSNFSRTFTKQVGKSPKRFQLECRKSQKT